MPGSLLVQLENDELNPDAIDRAKRWTEQDLLPLAILRQNTAIDPEAQLALAEEIEADLSAASRQLAWRSIPKYSQLKYACDLIWTYFYNERPRSAVFSANQLAFKISQLDREPILAKRVLSELKPGSYAAKNADEAVERVLQFDRNWAGFELPKSLMALSRIQEYLLNRHGLPSGDYSYYSARVESLFVAPIVIALEEYGLPMQLTLKVLRFFRTENDLDTALNSVLELDIDAMSLQGFERYLMQEMKNSIAKK